MFSLDSSYFHGKWLCNHKSETAYRYRYGLYTRWLFLGIAATYIIIIYIIMYILYIYIYIYDNPCYVYIIWLKLIYVTQAL